MEIREVMLNRYIKEICPGIRYEGIITIDGFAFDFRLIFPRHLSNISITDIHSNRFQKDVASLRILIDGSEINLNSQEYTFFLSLIGGMVIDMYCLSGNANPRLENTFSEQEPVNIIRVYIISEEQDRMLSSPKFSRVCV